MGPFVPHNLISAQESPVLLLKFQMAPRLKILKSSGSKIGTQIYYPFLSKSPGKWIPSRFPSGAPMERERYPLTGHFYVSIYLSLRVPGMGAASTFPTDRDTASPEPLVYLFIHSFMSVCQRLQKGALLHTYRKNRRSLSTEPHADGRPTYNGVWPGSPRGSLTTLLSLPQYHATLGTIPSTLAWVDHSPIA